MAITNPDANTIRLTNESAADFDDIVSAGVSGITKTGNNTFFITRDLQLVNSKLSDTKKVIKFEWGVRSLPLSIDTDSELQLGELDGDGYGVNGCSVYIYHTNTGTASLGSAGGAAGNLKLYGCSMQGESVNNGNIFWRFYSGIASQVVDIRDCYFHNFFGGGRFQGANSKVVRCRYINCIATSSPFTTKSPFGEISGNRVFAGSNSYYWFPQESGTLTVSSAYGRDNDTAAYISDNTGSTDTLTFVDADFDSWAFTWVGTNNTGVRVREDYNYVPTILDQATQSAITSGRVYIENLAGTQAHNEALDGSGQVGELTLRAGQYRASTGNTRTDETPHTIKVRCYGYLFQEFPVDIGVRTVTNLSQVENNFVVANEATASGYSSKINVNFSTKTIAISGNTTPQEVYDYTQYAATLSGNIQYDEIMTATAPGVFVFDDQAKVVIANGGTLTVDNDGSKGIIEFGALAEGNNYIQVQNGGTLSVGTDGRQATMIKFGRGTTSASWLESNQDILVQSGGTWEWYGGIIECNNAVWTLAGSTLVIEGNAQLLGNTAPSALRFSNVDTDISSIIMNNSAIVWFAIPTTDDLEGMSFVNILGQCFVGLDIDNTFIDLRGFDIFDPSITKGYGYWDNRWARLINHEHGSELIAKGNLADNVNNKGLLEVRQEIEFSATSGGGAVFFTRDTNNGNRLAANQILNNPNYLTNRDYTLTESGGTASYTTDGGVLIGVHWRDTGGLLDSNNEFDSRGLNDDYTDLFTWMKLEYGQLVATLNVTMKGKSIVQSEIASLPDNVVSESNVSTVAAYTGIAIAAGTITLTENHTINELYDYIKYWQTQNPDAVWDNSKTEIIQSADGFSFALNGYDLVVDGCTLGGLATQSLTIGGEAVETDGGSIALPLVIANAGVLTVTDLDNITGRVTMQGGGTWDIEDDGTAPAGSATATDTIEITSADANDVFDFSVNGFEFDEDTTFENSSGSNIILRLSAAQTVPDLVETSGTITVDNAVTVNVTAPNLIDGTRIQIYNVTADTELFNEVVSGGSGFADTITVPGDADVGDTLRMRATYVSGATASCPIQTTNAVSLGGVSFANEQIPCPVYNSYAIDGSAVAEFSWDGVNVQFDVNDPDNTWYVSRLYAWNMYWLMSEIGIRDTYGYITAIDVANIQIDNAAALDNLKSVTAIQGDNIRLFRPNGTIPVVNPTTGGGGFTFYSTGVIYIAETGVSGLTGAESTTLDKLNGTLDANIVEVNSIPVTGSGTEIDPWGP
jgi:hypothetical protein